MLLIDLLVCYLEADDLSNSSLASRAKAKRLQLWLFQARDMT
jgi:hypothetical protein